MDATRIDLRAIGRVFGWFFLATILTSVPPYFVGYHQMLNDPGLITGAGAQPRPGHRNRRDATRSSSSISNVALTAVVAYPVLKRESEMGAIGYVAARRRRGHVHRDRDRQRPHVRADATGSHGRF